MLRTQLEQPVEVVTKMILPETSTADNMVNLLEENHLIKLLADKRHVVDIYEEIIEVNSTTNQIENYMVIVEKAVNDLSSITSIWFDEDRNIEESEYFSNEKLFYFLFKSCEALSYCHEQGVYYGDCKEANFLVFRDYKVKLGDFGVSFHIPSDTPPDEKDLQLKGLTYNYSLPNL